MTAREMASITKERSRRNGTMELESNEPKFILNEDGICIDVQPRQTGESEQMIEQLMVTANQAAAKLAEKEHLPFVYRVHENPKSLKIETLIELVSSLGLDFSGIKKGESIHCGVCGNFRPSGRYACSKNCFLSNSAYHGKGQICH